MSNRRNVINQPQRFTVFLAFSASINYPKWLMNGPRGSEYPHEGA
jgi:hypothetical protein